MTSRATIGAFAIAQKPTAVNQVSSWCNHVTPNLDTGFSTKDAKAV